MGTSSFKDMPQLLEAIYEILITKGPKSCTMDFVAREIKMSKRTLYEIFEDKNDMIIRALDHHSAEQRKAVDEIIRNAPDMMTALLKMFALHRETVRRVTVNFFKDMDRLYPQMRLDYQKRHANDHIELIRILRQGAEQGVFRDNINFEVLSHVIQLQAESQKCMEDKMPAALSPLDIYDTMMECFFRSIASYDGLKILEESIDKYRKIQDEADNLTT